MKRKFPAKTFIALSLLALLPLLTLFHKSSSGGVHVVGGVDREWSKNVAEEIRLRSDGSYQQKIIDTTSKGYVVIERVGSATVARKNDNPGRSYFHTGKWTRLGKHPVVPGWIALSKSWIRLEGAVSPTNVVALKSVDKARKIDSVQPESDFQF
jgi:hypothetical protein